MTKRKAPLVESAETSCPRDNKRGASTIVQCEVVIDKLSLELEDKRNKLQQSEAKVCCTRTHIVEAQQFNDMTVDCPPRDRRQPLAQRS